MKWHAITFIVWMILLVISVPYALGQTPTQPRRQRITITSTLEAIRTNGVGNQVRFFLLWAKDIRSRPIGHAYSNCQEGPGDAFICTTNFSLPLGRLVTQGVIYTNRRYTAVITGGSRSLRAVRADHPGYVGAKGTLISLRLAPGDFQLIFLLEPQ